jgi:hypothetical protein
MAKTDKTLQTEKASTGNLPSWDILPPFQFINPRVRTVEKKEEPNHESQPVRQLIAPSASATTTHDVVGTASSEKQTDERCPACGSPVETEAGFCGECGLRLSDTTAVK